MPSYPSITFGVELELMTPFPESYRMWRYISPSAASRFNMADLLAKRTSLPIAAQCTHAPDDRCVICTTVPKENQFSGDCVLQFPDVLSYGEVVSDRCFIFKSEFLEFAHPLSIKRSWDGVELTTPVFHSGELDSGLPTMNTALTNLRQLGLQISADDSCGMHVHVGVETGMTILLAQKITTLVILLENTLLLRLVAPPRWKSGFSMPICENSSLATDMDLHSPLEDPTALNQHVPDIGTMKPGKWNNWYPKSIYKMFNGVWGSTILADLSLRLKKARVLRCGFAMSLRDHNMTFDHGLLRNWTEILSGIVVIAQGDAEKFKRCVEKIIKINGEDDKDVWKGLMTDVLGLGHRIPQWETQFERFERGEFVSHLDDQLLLKSI
ncbi:uncharacterized protein BKA55DRAFT_513721 [Fusarium redolens]|uniref:Uncharacterized protein n=1 Tax=Fusarium redolens TaxID=48865 RepID=A0A9P9K465_FUSRE|nr:uncharacterized protein BKA55DRAFT_513721 [Fusarium redolens]KAH7248652.1 hypothetical protein BKA55DRAFT_513721 [Fusarium redolens]